MSQAAHFATSRLMPSMTSGASGCVSEKPNTSAPNCEPGSGCVVYACSVMGAAAVALAARNVGRDGLQLSAVEPADACKCIISRFLRVAHVATKLADL